jgi:acetyl/propionyl-CoA carboxylase alpha subunit
MARAIRKLLIANRGEIALRIVRSARAMGIRTVAVYSDVDAIATHVGAADEAYPLGAPEPVQSYLNITNILAAARTSGADAVHPGYGFLSERPEFARAVTAAGLTFVGPPADVMASLGDKLAARGIAVAAGVPVVSGSEVGDLASAREFGARVGFPILVKAAAGGGGRGMRVVEDASALEDALEAAAREAQAAFGDGRVFLEKYLARPRHVEIQLLGDDYGKIVALGERDCSIQRRHQKLIEESPAPGLSDALRQRLVESALRLARAAGYRNAGTAEFLVDGNDHYFLEINARLQVEHPVTELRYDRDLVCDQLAIATGAHVAEPSSPRGAAIECRINAEDAAHDFRPVAGRVFGLRLPAGPGVRIDTWLGGSDEVTSYYDSLIAKLICWGRDREQARMRTLGALGEFWLLGLQNTTAFLRDVIASPAFRRGDLSTRFIPDFFADWRWSDAEIEAALLAAAQAVTWHGRHPSRTPAGDDRSASSPWAELGHFELWNRR